ncbi:unnamed protein product, partial [Mesorhabditis belari]|uniref:Neurotransmitter-gated ion-channel ligand-binding domain-containing protein n=1 Tax=Mesorhabditis belari TaxID=2138241 RepID=A0AAF3FK74_9BILA
MDLTYFPFDVQTCVVGFDTYTYNYSMVTQNGAIWRDFDKRIFKSVDEKLIKLTLGLTTMMSMTVLLDLVSNQIPKTSQFPVLGIYVIIDFCIIGVSCALIVILPRDKGSWKAKEA